MSKYDSFAEKKRRERGVGPRGSNIDHQSELSSAAELKYLASDIKFTDLCPAAMLLA